MSPLKIAFSPFGPTAALKAFSSAHWSKWKLLLVRVRSHVAFVLALASVVAMWGYISSACMAAPMNLLEFILIIVMKLFISNNNNDNNNNINNAFQLMMS